jgi:hypothetical protein
MASSRRYRKGKLNEKHMHRANMMYWLHCSEKYKPFFRSPSRVIEFGSYNINGSIRRVFACEDYTGLDWRPGPCVDVVSLAHEYRTDKIYDTVVSASMLEHDPHWEQSIENMLSVLADDGIMVLTWGAALNEEHCLEEAPDGGFHCLPAGKVVALLERNGMYVHELQYEQLFCQRTGQGRGGMGEVGLVAFRNKKNAIGDPIIDELIEEDRV